MFILPSFRRQGIGAQLLASALERARAGGFSMLEVGTPPEGARQGRFYARAGFLRFGDRWRFAFPRPQPASIS
jgi:GNAT superfamily N-acetyltransferase